MASAVRSDGQIAVVVGASGGIGAALATELASRDAYARTVAIARNGPIRCDVTREDDVAAAARHLREAGAPVRLVIDASGFLHGAGYVPEKSWREIDPQHLAHAFAVNAIGPALLMKHFLPLLPRDGRAVFATLSARVGSIEDNRLGGWYAYRASKAALNQLVRTAAVELRRRNPSAAVVAIHPGTVATPLSAPFSKKGLEVTSPDAAARRLLDTCASLDPALTGAFIDADGNRLPW